MGKALILGMTLLVTSPLDGLAATYYVRQTVGDDANDGLSAKTAWRRISRLSTAMGSGDTAYVGPGLYREEIAVQGSGAADSRLTFVADTTGQHTGDPPGVVMITGADPVAASIFTPHSAPGVYLAQLGGHVVGVVEMDGPQYRYLRLRETKEYAQDKMSELDIVAKFPSSYFYDEQSKVLYVHTSDGQHPSTHEIEIIRRGNGISMSGKHHVTVIGFTVRHVGDAGINFFRGSGDVVAINNTAYGSRQGIRVYGATNVLVYGNTLFRNENSGVYFAAESVNGQAIRNIAFENVKGLRWSSKSVHGLAIDNTLFDNRERGLAIENADGAVVRGNRLVNNATSQLLVIQTQYDSEGNCFENGGPAQLTADFFFVDRYKALGDYQRVKGQDQHSREGGCGPLPEKPDVRKLHLETMRYADRAREILTKSPGASSATPR